MTFQTGELRGREFEVNYDSEKKEFEIITQWPYDNDMQLPSEPLVPAPGNEYVLWNISMPDSYYPAAEQEFKTAVDTWPTAVKIYPCSRHRRILRLSIKETSI